MHYYSTKIFKTVKELEIIDVNVKYGEAVKNPKAVIHYKDKFELR
jgi:hypothetical protein